MQPLDLIAQAQRLAKGGRKPRQADLRRAVSSAYYAMFHTLARTCADMLVGTNKATRSEPAWVQTYRALAHGRIKRTADHSELKKFPESVASFAGTIVDLQRHRHSADYDPTDHFTREGVLKLVSMAEESIRAFKVADAKDRRAFAVLVLFDLRRR